MDATNRIPDPPTPMKSDAETTRLWEALLIAKHDDDYRFQASYNVQRLLGHFDIRPLDLRPPLTPELQSLIQRTDELDQAWKTYEQQSSNNLDEAAWRFVAHAFDLHLGDCVIYDRLRPTGLWLTRLMVCGDTVNDLIAEGLILKKDGKPGKREGRISLLRTPWRKLPARS